MLKLARVYIYSKNSTLYLLDKRLRFKHNYSDTLILISHTANFFVHWNKCTQAQLSLNFMIYDTNQIKHKSSLYLYAVKGKKRKSSIFVFWRTADFICQASVFFFTESVSLKKKGLSGLLLRTNFLKIHSSMFPKIFKITFSLCKCFVEQSLWYMYINNIICQLAKHRNKLANYFCKSSFHFF